MPFSAAKQHDCMEKAPNKRKREEKVRRMITRSYL